MNPHQIVYQMVPPLLFPQGLDLVPRDMMLHFPESVNERSNGTFQVLIT